jgi:hypothetical protein
MPFGVNFGINGEFFCEKAEVTSGCEKFEKVIVVTFEVSLLI